MINMYDIHIQIIILLVTQVAITKICAKLQINFRGQLDAAPMVTHILGLEDVAYVTIMFLIFRVVKASYPHCKIELTAIEDFAEKGKTDPRLQI